MGFDTSKSKVTARQAIILNKAEEEMPSACDVPDVDDIVLQKSTENVAKSTENLIEQLESEFSEDLPRGSLRVEVANRVQLEENIKEKKCKLKEF